MNEKENPKDPAFVEFGDGVRLNANDNFQPRCPVALILDASGSMTGEPIAAVNQALPGLIHDLQLNDLTASRVELAVISCGGEAKLLTPFGPLAALAGNEPKLVASGETPLGGAIELALAEIARRQIHYRDTGIAQFAPCVIALTDGHPTDHAWLAASTKLGELARNKGWTVVAVGVGPHADMSALQTITGPALPPLGLASIKDIAALFQWLSCSLQAGTASAPTGQSASGFQSTPPSPAP